ncbi:acyl-CoA dehydratase activase [Desulfothermobacter acidiphilus]|uniref:acyl-CoA dehydratase activase n=1 Tax=Desulfothermobacter acidiphilus TaxID=1938353 RepID=UPI003F88DF49
MLVAGIDIGSLSAEAVILDAGEIRGYSILATGASSRQAAEKALAEALAAGQVEREALEYVVATGYGRVNVPFAHRQVTEITCHARGAVHLIPSTRLVIDIGGQDSKVIKVGPGGVVEDFVMNDKCAAGTGRFLEVMARALETDLEGFSELAARARRAAAISSMCTVFAESEVVSLIGQGTPREEIALGLCQAIAERVAAMVHRLGPLQPTVTMTGGVAKNRSVVEALANKLGMEVVVPPEPQIVGALGAALIAHHALLRGIR